MPRGAGQRRDEYQQPRDHTSRDKPAGTPAANGGGRTRDRQIGDKGIELAVGPTPIQRSEAFLELIRRQSPLRGGVAQALGDLLPICIRGSKRRHTAHA